MTIARYWSRDWTPIFIVIALSVTSPLRCRTTIIVLGRPAFMKSTTDYSFIDLAKLGRTHWRTTLLTVMLIASISILGTLGVLMLSGWSLYSSHFRITDLGKTLVHAGSDPVVCVFGFLIACKWILHRPFRSLISADLNFSFRRCLFGAAVFLPANLIALAAMALYASIRDGAWIIPFGHFRQPNGSQIFAACIAVVGIPFLAFAEELLFRGWLTQTLRQYVRPPLAVVAIVAMAFAAYHTQYDFHMKVLLFFASFGFSALSLRDQRLELAIGAHTMLNISVALNMLFFTGLPHIQTSVQATTFDWVSLVVLKGVLPFALMYWFLQKTDGWFVPNRETRVVDAQQV